MAKPAVELDEEVAEEYSETFGISKERVNEIFAWMQSPANRLYTNPSVLAEKAVGQFGDEFDDEEDADELCNELAGLLYEE